MDFVNSFTPICDLKYFWMVLLRLSAFSGCLFCFVFILYHQVKAWIYAQRCPLSTLPNKQDVLYFSDWFQGWSWTNLSKANENFNGAQICVELRQTFKGVDMANDLKITAPASFRSSTSRSTQGKESTFLGQTHNLFWSRYQCQKASRHRWLMCAKEQKGRVSYHRYYNYLLHFSRDMPFKTCVKIIAIQNGKIHIMDAG